MHPVRSCVLALLGCSASCLAQTALSAPDFTQHRYEAGLRIQYSAYEPCAGSAYCSYDRNSYAVGATAEYHFTSAIGAVVVLDSLPVQMTDSVSWLDGSVTGGYPLRFLTGPDFSAHSKRWAIFFSPRIGLTSYSKAPVGFSGTETTTSSTSTTTTIGAGQILGRETFFTAHIAFGGELALPKRLRLRVEAGDEIVGYGQARFENLPHISYQDAWPATATLASSLTYSFGKELPTNRLLLLDPAPHPFFDRTNLLLLGTVLSAQIADAISTQRFVSAGAIEGDPLVRPLVDHGWSGQLAVGSVVFAGETGLMYALHKTHHHKIERVVPLALATVSAVFAYENEQYVPQNH